VKILGGSKEKRIGGAEKQDGSVETLDFDALAAGTLDSDGSHSIPIFYNGHLRIGGCGWVVGMGLGDGDYFGGGILGRAIDGSGQGGGAKYGLAVLGGRIRRQG